MKLSFQRITTSGRFIPEIDGLRFIAIVSVIFYHLNLFFSVKDVAQYKDAIDYSYLYHFLYHGDLGVPLFFVISGFILGLPFANFYIQKAKPVSLKKYFLRRLTRLEPPYILVMTILLLGAVFVAQTLSVKDGLFSYFASIIYSHDFIYPGVLPKLNVVAWSLEIEVQFYILAPLLAYLFSINSVKSRRLLLVGITLIFLIINAYCTFPVKSLLEYLQYFLVGFLLVDLYVSKSSIVGEKTKFDPIIGFCFFIIIWLFDKTDFSLPFQKLVWDIIQLTSIFFFYYYVLFRKVFKVLSLKIITNIGGMCYSIYLLHYPLISIVGNPLLKVSFSEYSFINVTVYTVILLSTILLISAGYFLLVERPCMDKDWVKKVVLHLKN